MLDVDTNDEEEVLNVPAEATAFLAAVSACAVLLFVIFVYINKKWRILNVGLGGPSNRGGSTSSGGRGGGVGALSSLTKQHEGTNSRASPFKGFPLGDSYILSPESSSESEEDMLRKLRHQMGVVNHDERIDFQGVGMIGGGGGGRRAPSLSTTAVRSFSVDQASDLGHLQHHHQHHVFASHHHQPQRHPLLQQRSFDLPYHPLHQSTPGPTVDPHQYHHSSYQPPLQHHTQLHRQSSSGSSSSFTNSRPLRVVGGREVMEDLPPGPVGSTTSSRRRAKGMMVSSSVGGRGGGGGGDLMSLAEKGKVNGGSSASSTSSNGSTEDDPSRTQQHQPHPPPLPRPSSSSHHRTHHQGVIMRTHPIRVDTRPISASGTTTLVSSTPQAHHQPSHAQATGGGGGTIITHSASCSTHPHPNQQNSAPSSSTGFRRMLPPRTKSLDSESPPPSEQGCSTYGDSLADQDDHIFEVEEMSLVGGELVMANRGTTSPTQCGSVEVGFDYEAAARKMTVHIIQVRGVPHKDVGGANNSQIRLVLLPDKKQKHKTKVRPGENPSFMDAFVFNKVNPEDVSSLGIRFRLYGCERMRRERLLGECSVGFASLHLEMETTMWLNFEPRYHLSWDSKSETGSLARSDSASSTASIQSGIPEMLVGLAYNGTTGRLTVEIIKGSHFRQLAGGRAPDSYVKLVLVSCSGQEMGRAKTSLRRAQSNPLFKETFMFQVALFQVQEVTLLVSVYGRKGVTRRELLGWFALGYNSSGDEETQHWEDMCDAQGDQMCRWHILQT